MNNKRIALLIICFSLFFTAIGQVGIGTTTPNASAQLDVSSTSKGLLIPRLTTIQRTGIASPATGLQVFDTDTKTFWFYNGTGWIQSATGAPTNYWSLNGTHIFNSNAGNVGIGLNAPLAPLHIKTNDEALRLQGNTPYISFYDNGGINKSYIQSFNSNLFFGTPSTNTTGNVQFYLANNPVMTMLPSGNVGIGTAVPDEKLTVQTFNNSYGITHRGEGGNVLGTRMGGTSAGIGTFSNTNMRIFSNNNSAVFINASNSYVGLGGDFPVNKFQIGTITNPGPNYTGNDFAISNGTNAMRIYQSPNATVIASDNTNMVLWPKEATGNVGINTLQQPTNKLQIGSVGSTGFATNDLAIGNGTAAMAIFQTNASTLIGSSTDIVLKPRNNGAGRVGINTNTPRAPLDVINFADVPDGAGSSVDYAYLALRYVNFQPDAFLGGTTQPLYARVSIFASHRIVATEFDANSDARIKNISGISNPSKDLETITNLRITDYTMKDKIKYGNQTYKKVIAQEVEKVYPQVVSKHTDFIPNVFQPSAKLTKTANGYLISFNAPHKISSEAKKLQVLIEASGMQRFDIVSIPSEKEVIIKATDLNSNKVFVYGEEVDDFRTVDYEGLTTLNISATQELTKLIKGQKLLIEQLIKRIDMLEKKSAESGISEKLSKN
jgi:hypothetical protein